MNDPDDNALVAGSLRGDNDSFKSIVERYEKPLYNLAFRMTGNQDDAQDITQSAFVKAYENLSTFDPDRKFFSWLYRIAMNEALNFKRGQKLMTQAGDDIASPDESHDRALEAEEQRAHVERAVASLSPELRSVVVLHYFSECSYDNISEILGVPERTVKSRLYIAREKLRRILNRRTPR